MRIALPSALLLLLVACGARRERPPVNAEDDDQASITLVDDGLQLVFPQVDAAKAREQVFRCQFNPPSDNPRHAGLQCPVDLGAAKIEVDEGPAGVSVMIRIGARPAKLLRDWYRRNLQ